MGQWGSLSLRLTLYYWECRGLCWSHLPSDRLNLHVVSSRQCKSNSWCGRVVGLPHVHTGSCERRLGLFILMKIYQCCIYLDLVLRKLHKSNTTANKVRYMNLILLILIFIIYLSIFYYHGVLVHILESRSWEPSDDQEEGNSANLNNFILISDRWLYYPALISVGKCPTDSDSHSRLMSLVFVSH